MFWNRKPPAASPAAPLSRRDKLCGSLNIAGGVGLEFGPLNTPIIAKSEGDVRYVDAKTTEELRRDMPAGNGYDASAFVEIDYVWRRPFREAVGGVQFDYALACHVIEHTPNMLGWLNDIASVLKPGGLISLAIPDKRHTFDVLRQPTTCATVVSDFLRGETRPRAHHVFDHCFNVVNVTPGGGPGPTFMALCRGEIDPRDLPRIFSREDALNLARRAEDNPEIYTDVHCYVFTPQTFLDIIEATRALGLHSLSVVEFHDTEPYGIEFHVKLQV